MLHKSMGIAYRYNYLFFKIISLSVFTQRVLIIFTTLPQLFPDPPSIPYPLNLMSLKSLKINVLPSPTEYRVY